MENRGGGKNDGVAELPARGHDDPMRTDRGSLFVFVSNGFAEMMGLQQSGVVAANNGIDPGELPGARVCSGGGRTAVTN